VLALLVFIALSCKRTESEEEMLIRHFFDLYKTDIIIPLNIKSGAFTSDFITEGNLNCDSIVRVYPLLKSLNGLFYVVDSFEVNNIIKEENNLSIVELTTFHMNGKDGIDSRNITFYIKKDESDENRYIISDSKGFCPYEGFFLNEDMFDFGKKIGAITKEDSTDLLISNKVANAEIFHKYKVNVLTQEIREKVNFKRLDWRMNNSKNSLAITASVTNSSDYNILFPEYAFHLFDNEKKYITRGTGSINYGTLESGNTEIFSFVIDNVKNACHLDLRINNTLTLESIIKNEVKNQTYKGTEYNEFLKLGIIK
jgi:hypothetical protein